MAKNLVSNKKLSGQLLKLLKNKFLGMTCSIKDKNVLDQPTVRQLLGRDQAALVTYFVNMYNIRAEQTISKNILYNVQCETWCRMFRTVADRLLAVLLVFHSQNTKRKENRYSTVQYITIILQYCRVFEYEVQYGTVWYK